MASSNHPGGAMTTREHNETFEEIAIICWWLHRTNLYRTIKNWVKVRLWDAETIERMVRTGREARLRMNPPPVRSAPATTREETDHD